MVGLTGVQQLDKAVLGGIDQDQKTEEAVRAQLGQAQTRLMHEFMAASARAGSDEFLY